MQPLPQVGDGVAGGGAVVDEQGDLHRVGRRLDPQHLARDGVFAHDEVRGTEVGDRRARLVEDADVHGLLERLREGGRRRDEHEGGEERKRATSAQPSTR